MCGLSQIAHARDAWRTAGDDEVAETIGERHATKKGLRVSRKLAVATVCLAALLLPSSAAAGESDIGRIAYTSDRTGNDEIFSARVDGYGEQNLTGNAAVDQSPAWSPDGSKIAFVSDRSGRMDLWVMNWDGSDQHQVTSGDAGSSDFDPAWSPDGARLVFSSSRGDGSYHLWTVDLADGSVRQLTSDWGTQPSWSPDGSRIAYAGTSEIRAVDADGSGDQQLTYCACTGPAGSPAWSRDGSFLVFGRYDDDWQSTNARQLYYVGANGGQGLPLTSGAYYNGHPAFSPGGSMLLFQRQQGVFGSPELYYMKLSDLVPYPSVTGPGRNFVASWGPTYAPPPPPPPADDTPPTITIRTPTTSGTDRMDVYTVGQVVLADYECADAGSGVRHCDGPAADGQPLDTRFVGTFEFRVFAADQAGNPAYKSAWYRVVYPFGGYAAPVANGALTDLRAGDSVPLKFSLGADYGLDVVTSATQQPIDCATRAPLGATAPAGGTLTYNTSQARYLYDWSSQKAWAGTCRSVTLALRDGTQHEADFRLLR
jgi:dipeptidyl aminopeptidase/acylaminoacyl peptidase